MALLCAVSLPVGCIGRNSKTIAKPKVPAAEHRAGDTPASTANNPHKYSDLLAKVESERVTLALRHHRATSEPERIRVVAEAR